MTKPKVEDIDFKYNLGVYFSFLKNYKGMVLLLLFFVLLGEISQALDKLLFKLIIDKGELFVKNSLDLNTFTTLLVGAGVAYILIIVIRSIVDWWKHYFLAKLDANLIKDLKEKYFSHVIGLSHNFHSSHKTGSLIARITRGGRAIESMTDIIVFNFLPLFFQVFIVTGLLLSISWIPALIMLVTMVIFISYSVFLQKLQKRANVEKNDQEDLEKGTISDILTNIDSIKYFGKEKLIEKKYASIAKETKKKEITLWNFYNWLSAGQSFIIGIGLFGALLFPLLDFLNGDISIGSLTFIYLIYANLRGPVFSFVHGLRNYYRVMADFESLFYYGKITNEIKDKSNAKNIDIKHGTIEFENIDFKYHKRRIFKDFSLSVKKNQKIALVGHSGCGKSTLIKLLYRLYDIEKGRILIDGKDIRDIKQESLRSELSIVPQECVLFDDTIYNNIKFSNPKATDKEIKRAIKFAQLDKIIRILPEKEKTIVGERGVKLSGGEKQRVSIARAVLANKKILVLDEATSSLDSETEYEIQKDLQKLMKNRTSIIIAHRLSTIMHSDKIVVMQRGKIVEIGTHRTLLKKKGHYFKLWNLQKGGYIK
ncbi:ABC transporter ATP-binding protein [Candidatus Woesearchaeota archaeon]|jgi:ATP-binding cassette, subfamily B, heavy metal transporter|nr:ABC transporter ATP-binding protein [Candidatus Woesearchaeota archaeon]MBT5215403.1 ABC transporter ATP-binding protein [Candidatus Woesearchaeota archaeon]